MVDALIGIDAEYEVKLAQDRSSETAIVLARCGGVSFRVVVEEEPSGSHRIMCSRLSGDTFSYHDAFRQLRQCLQDAVGSAEPTGRGVKRRFEGAEGAATGKLAPMPSNETAPMSPPPPRVPLAPAPRLMDMETAAGAAAVQEVRRDCPSSGSQAAEGR